MDWYNNNFLRSTRAKIMSITVCQHFRTHFYSIELMSAISNRHSRSNKYLWIGYSWQTHLKENLFVGYSQQSQQTCYDMFLTQWTQKYLTSDCSYQAKLNYLVHINILNKTQYIIDTYSIFIFINVCNYLAPNQYHHFSN